MGYNGFIKRKGKGKMTKHSQANLIKFLEENTIQEADAAKLLAKCRKALGISKYRGSCAVVVKLEGSVSKSYSHRDYWGDSNILVAIIRNGKVVTVMLSREEQNHTTHYRTDYIFS